MSDFRAKVLSSLKWTAGAKFTAQLFAWGVTFVVIRLLTDEDYGLMALAYVVVSFFMVVNQAGLGAALVQVKELDETMKRQVFAFALLLNGSIFLVLLVSASLIADFYNDERLVNIIRVLAAQFVLYAFAAVPQAMLERELRMKSKSLVDLAATLSSSALQLYLAVEGFGVWCLVWGNLALVVVSVVGMNFVAPYFSWPSFRFRGFGQLFGFGGKVTLSRILWYFYSQADVMIAGKLLSKDALGVYYIAMYLASMPMQKLIGILNQVFFPAFSRIQDDLTLVRQYLLKAVRGMSFIAFPALWGMMATAPEIVTVIIGGDRTAVILPLQLLSFVVPLRMINGLLSSVFNGVGRPGLVIETLVVMCVLMPAAFGFGLSWGITGLCLAWVIGFPLVMLRNLYRILPEIDMRLSAFYGAMLKSVACAGLMVATIYVMRALFVAHVSAQAMLAILIAAGLVSYPLFSLVLNRGTAFELLDLLKKK